VFPADDVVYICILQGLYTEYYFLINLIVTNTISYDDQIFLLYIFFFIRYESLGSIRSVRHLCLSIADVVFFKVHTLPPLYDK